VRHEFDVEVLIYRKSRTIFPLCVQSLAATPVGLFQIIAAIPPTDEQADGGTKQRKKKAGHNPDTGTEPPAGSSAKIYADHHDHLIDHEVSPFSLRMIDNDTATMLFFFNSIDYPG
jgi:hypothetical protein